MSKRYIHYGSNNFDKKRVNVINPHYTALPCKPLFGLWASPVEPTYRSWEEWCRGEDFCLSHLEKYFTFTLSDDAKVLEVRQPSDISKYANDTIHRFMTCIDFNKIIEDGCDAVEVYMNSELYYYLYGWDCDSIVIFNPNIVIPETVNNKGRVMYNEQKAI